MKRNNLSKQDKLAGHKVPLSLISDHQGISDISKLGDVSEVMDKAIGRLVYRIQGSVSSQNYLAVRGYELPHHLLHIQLCRLGINPVTFHLEVETSNGGFLRISLSTLYEKEPPRFLGRSLRAPLRLPEGWVVVVIDLRDIVERFCITSSPNRWQFKSLKGVQICSNVLFRDIVIADYIIDSQEKFPKELMVKPTSKRIMVYNLDFHRLGCAVPYNSKIHTNDNISLSQPNVVATPTDVCAENVVSGKDSAVDSDNKLSSNATNIKSVPVTEINPLRGLVKIDHSVSYRGGTVLLIFSGRLLVTGSSSFLLLIDLWPSASRDSGIWKAFVKSGDSPQQYCLLKGHQQKIDILQVSSFDHYVASVENTESSSLLILWDFRVGKRVASLKPPTGKVLSVSFSSNNEYMVTVGLDSMARYLAIVWNINIMVGTKGVVNVATVSAVVAKQTSDFPIVSISFHPGDPQGLVSCGRENIRLWRIKKDHLTGRPVILNQFSRGILYKEICFEAEKPCFYVSSNKGLLLKVCHYSNQVLCAFHLHDTDILSFRMMNNFAVTGTVDGKFRIWPLDFADYLLESRHEGGVSGISVASDAQSVAIGTLAGTLGILNISEHSYKTVLRSHVKEILVVNGNNQEGLLASISEDKTIRVWSSDSFHQSLEFFSEADSPRSICWAKGDQILLCGFESGFLRLFEVSSGEVIAEHFIHSNSIEKIQSYVKNGVHYAVTADAIGNFIISSFSFEQGYSVSVVMRASIPRIDENNHVPCITLNKDNSLIIISFGMLSSSLLISTATWKIFHLAFPSKSFRSIPSGDFYEKGVLTESLLSASLLDYQNFHEPLLVLTTQTLVLISFEEDDIVSIIHDHVTCKVLSLRTIDKGSVISAIEKLYLDLFVFSLCSSTNTCPLTKVKSLHDPDISLCYRLGLATIQKDARNQYSSISPIYYITDPSIAISLTMIPYRHTFRLISGNKDGGFTIWILDNVGFEKCLSSASEKNGCGEIDEISNSEKLICAKSDSMKFVRIANDVSINHDDSMSVGIIGALDTVEEERSSVSESATYAAMFEHSPPRQVVATGIEKNYLLSIPLSSESSQYSLPMKEYAFLPERTVESIQDLVNEVKEIVDDEQSTQSDVFQVPAVQQSYSEPYLCSNAVANNVLPDEIKEREDSQDELAHAIQSPWKSLDCKFKASSTVYYIPFNQRCESVASQLRSHFPTLSIPYGNSGSVLLLSKATYSAFRDNRILLSDGLTVTGLTLPSVSRSSLYYPGLSDLEAGIILDIEVGFNIDRTLALLFNAESNSLYLLLWCNLEFTSALFLEHCFVASSSVCKVRSMSPGLEVVFICDALVSPSELKSLQKRSALNIIFISSADGLSKSATSILSMSGMLLDVHFIRRMCNRSVWMAEFAVFSTEGSLLISIDFSDYSVRVIHWKGMGPHRNLVSQCCCSCEDGTKFAILSLDNAPMCQISLYFNNSDQHSDNLDWKSSSFALPLHSPYQDFKVLSSMKFTSTVSFLFAIVWDHCLHLFLLRRRDLSKRFFKTTFACIQKIPLNQVMPIAIYSFPGAENHFFLTNTDGTVSWLRVCVSEGDLKNRSAKMMQIVSNLPRQCPLFLLTTKDQRGYLISVSSRSFTVFDSQFSQQMTQRFHLPDCSSMAKCVSVSLTDDSQWLMCAMDNMCFLVYDTVAFVLQDTLLLKKCTEKHNLSMNGFSLVSFKPEIAFLPHSTQNGSCYRSVALLQSHIVIIDLEGRGDSIQFIRQVQSIRYPPSCLFFPELKINLLNFTTLADPLRILAYSRENSQLMVLEGKIIETGDIADWHLTKLENEACTGILKVHLSSSQYLCLLQHFEEDYALLVFDLLSSLRIRRVSFGRYYPFVNFQGLIASILQGEYIQLVDLHTWVRTDLDFEQTVVRSIKHTEILSTREQAFAGHSGAMATVKRYLPDNIICWDVYYYSWKEQKFWQWSM